MMALFGGKESVARRTGARRAKRRPHPGVGPAALPLAGVRSPRTP
jgi:hypothetical protein